MNLIKHFNKNKKAPKSIDAFECQFLKYSKMAKISYKRAICKSNITQKLNKMAEKLIKIDELRPIVFMLNEERITYSKACELITQICKDKALIIDGVSSSYLWLKDCKIAWVQGSVGFPVKVEVISVDFKEQKADIKIDHQCGTIPFENLYQTEITCPCR